MVAGRGKLDAGEGFAGAKDGAEQGADEYPEADAKHGNQADGRKGYGGAKGGEPLHLV